MPIWTRSLDLPTAYGMVHRALELYQYQGHHWAFRTDDQENAVLIADMNFRAKYFPKHSLKLWEKMGLGLAAYQDMRLPDPEGHLQFGAQFTPLPDGRTQITWAFGEIEGNQIGGHCIEEIIEQFSAELDRIFEKHACPQEHEPTGTRQPESAGPVVESVQKPEGQAHQSPSIESFKTCLHSLAPLWGTDTRNACARGLKKWLVGLLPFHGSFLIWSRL